MSSAIRPVGITGYGGYIPRLRLSRKAVVEANAWYAPGLRGRGKGTRAMANWDEDSITLAVAAARDCLGSESDRAALTQVLLASGTLPFAERLNAGVVCGALRLSEQVSAADLTGTQTAALAGLSQALRSVRAEGGKALLLASDVRKTRAASSQELDFGDAAAALTIGHEAVIAECLGESALTTDFVDRFRLSGEDIDYSWEERWIRDEGISKLVPPVIAQALEAAGVAAQQVDHFVFPSTFAKMDAQLAKQCGVRPEAVVDNLAATVGDTGVAHGLLMLASVLEKATPGQTILLVQFGNGARAFVFRVTEAITAYRPQVGVSGWLARGVEETAYTRYLVYKDQLPVERGMRGEQDRKTALSTSYRHREALLGFVAGRCTKTGDVSFPPSRLSYTPGAAALDTQVPHPLAERRGRVLSWSAEYLSFHLSPPHQYGQVDFDGGGRVLMDFTDVSPGDIATGTVVEPVFRIKDIDDLRGYKRYFWKAVPARTVVEN